MFSNVHIVLSSEGLQKIHMFSCFLSSRNQCELVLDTPPLFCLPSLFLILFLVVLFHLFFFSIPYIFCCVLCIEHFYELRPCIEKDSLALGDT